MQFVVILIIIGNCSLSSKPKFYTLKFHLYRAGHLKTTKWKRGFGFLAGLFPSCP